MKNKKGDAADCSSRNISLGEPQLDLKMGIQQVPNNLKLPMRNQIMLLK